ncbi:MAG: PilZ domain-containing protein [Deltaproteobacteria bacterium]|nr:PilZ domain-containing protein [Deltaproteobacteria bacterium]
MATDSRWGKRFRTSLTIRFGVNGLSDSGVVHDISAFGFFIMTSNLYPDGTLLKIQIMTPEKEHISLEGTVQWSVKKRDNVKWLIKDSGMGIKIKRFHAGQEHYENICQLLCQKKAKKNQPAGGTKATGSPATGTRFLGKLFS